MPITEEERARKRAKKELRSGIRSGATDATRNAAVNAALWGNGKRKVYDWQKDYIRVPPSVRLQTKGETSKEKTPDTASQEPSSNKRPRAGDSSEVPVDLTERETAATVHTPPAKRAKIAVTPPAQRAAVMRIATVGAAKKANMVHAAAATNDATQETATAEMPAPAFATDDGLISTKKATKATKPAAARKPRAPTKTAAAKTPRVAKSKAAPKASPAEATPTPEPENEAPGPAQAADAAPQQQPTPPASFRSKSPTWSTQTAAESNKTAAGPAPAHVPAPAAAKPTPAEQVQQQRYERTADWLGAVEDPAVSEEVVKNAATAEEVAEFRRKLFAGELEDDDEPEEEKKIVYGDLVIDWGGVGPKADRRGSGVASSPQEATEYRERLEAKAEAGVREWDHDSLFGGSSSSSSSSSEEEEEEEEAEAEKIADEESSDDENDDEESDEEEEEAGAAAGMDAAEEADLEALLERELLGDEEDEEEEEDDTDEVESVESEEE
ncbi:hypothetical protein KJ359_000643 [Pestalotiopsis sp. 9143b]|nr:hypothetical protein KJ359_000643 [Pestalotiopsis sp. 9143b]